jgi:hypothetical protein
MPTYRCPKCGEESHRVQVDRAVDCPTCGTPLSPHPATEALAALEAMDDAAWDAPRLDLPPARIPVNAPGSTLSLVLGLLGFLCLGFFTGIPAIMAGSSALGHCRREPGRYLGKDTAIVGIVLGAIGCAWSTAIVMLLILFTLMRGSVH